MNQPADFKLEQRDGVQVAVLSGDWTAVRMGWANERLEDALRGKRGIEVDATQVGRCDTSGAHTFFVPLDGSTVTQAGSAGNASVPFADHGPAGPAAVATGTLTSRLPYVLLVEYA